VADLSPAAQAIWDAAWTNCPVQCGNIEGTRRSQIAAALIAAADSLQIDYSCSSSLGMLESCKDQLLALAAELRQEGQL